MESRHLVGRALNREELCALARLGVPLAGASLAEMGMALTDMAVVGRLGGLELAAVGLAGGIAFDMLAILMGILTIVGVLVAEAIGAGQHDSVGAIVGQAIRIALGLSVVMISFALALPVLLSWTPQDPGIVPLAQTYLHALIWAFPLAMIYGVLVDTATALDRTRTVFLVSTGAVILNAPLSWLFVFGLEEGAGLGVAGAGYATSLVHVIMVALLVWALLADRPIRQVLDPRAFFRRDRQARSEITRLGLPVAGMTVVESGMFSVITILMGGFGAPVLAAHHILKGFANVATTVAFALGDAATIRVAQALGGGDMKRARRTGHLAMIVGGLLLAGLALLCLMDPGAIAWVFLGSRDTDNAAVYGWVEALSWIGAIYVLASGLQILAEHALRGLKDTFVPMIQQTIGLWGLGLAGGAIAAYGLDLGAAGLWYGLAAGSGLTALLFVLRFQKLTRIKPS